MYSGLQMTCLP